jgi:CBS domain-containing protein
MQAADVMITDVVSVPETATVREVAQLMLDKRISGVPVVDAKGRIVGIVSEGDLLRRAEIGSQRKRSWWLELVAGTEQLASEYIRSHAVRVTDIMARDVVTATETTPLSEIATLLERHRIKRVPIVRGGKLVGIVSRANLVQALAAQPPAASVKSDDRSIRETLTKHIREQPWGMPWLLTTTVEDGVVTLWGPVTSEQIRASLRIAAETTPGVKDVKDEMFIWDPAMDYAPPFRPEPQKKAS